MRILAALFFAVIIFFCFPYVSYAASSSKITLSDAIYADLALRHNLDNVSLYYSDAKMGNDIKLNETRHWLPASTVKTFAAMYAFKLIKEGKLDISKTVTIDAKNNVPTELVTDEFPTLLEGEEVTLDRLITQMITQSDNTAFNVLLDVLGRDNITAYMQSLGLTHTRIGSKLNLDTSQEQYEFDVSGYGINTTTAEEYAKAFALIKNKKIPGAQELFAILQKQKINNMIPLYLPKDVACAHKTGELDPLYHDGGICQDKKQSYVLTIFSNAGETSLVAHLSQIIYTKNFDLVGQDLGKPTVGETPTTDHPLDPLVFTTPKTVVLGTTTPENFTSPVVTAADLGITANDLSLVIKDSGLPKVGIPHDSTFHFFVDALQLTKKAVAFGPKARRDVDLESAKIRLSEANDLIKRGKTEEGHAVIGSLQPDLNSLAKDATIVHDASAQNTIAAISETRFAILAQEVKQTSGDAKLALIKSIAAQAKETVQTVSPKLPDAANASNPSQKPLIGKVVATTPDEVTVKTAGGQQIVIPITNTEVTVKEKEILFSQGPTPIAENVSPSPTQPPTVASLKVGTTVALFGSSTNNTFAPSLILTNIPRELAAPVPVAVAKVDTKHNTMVVVENGVYTQVNINKDTAIKGVDTNIPLKTIKEGDVVVVHGTPLVQTPPSNSVSGKPTQVPSPTSLPSQTQKINSLSPTLLVSPTTFLQKNQPTSQQNVVIPSQSVPNRSQNSLPYSQTQPTILPQKGVISQPSPVLQNTTRGTSPTSQQPSQPRVIQSTSIQVIEKKRDVPLPPPQAPTSKPAQNSAPVHKEAPKQEPKTPAVQQVIPTEPSKKK